MEQPRAENRPEAEDEHDCEQKQFKTLELPLEAVVAAKEGCEQTLRAYQVLQQPPNIKLIPGFLNDDEINHLLGLAEAASAWVPSIVWRGGEMSQRNSSSFMLCTAQTPVVESIERRAALVAGVPVEQVERLNLVRYLPGQFFGEHHDGKSRPKTVFVYLNDVDGGGETRFTKIGVQVKPQKGCAVAWKNLTDSGAKDLRANHQGMPPLRGIKYALNCFITKYPRDSAPTFDGSDQTLPEYWSRSSRGTHNWFELNLRKLAEISLSPEQLASALHEADESKVTRMALCRLHVATSPWMKAVPGFLRACETRDILKMCSPGVSQWEPAHTSSDGGTSEYLILDKLPHLESVKQRLSAILHVDSSLVGDVRIERYLPGQYTIKRHAGASWAYTGIVYLDDAPHDEDSVTDFKYISVIVRPLKGTALVWSNLWPDGGVDERLMQTETPSFGTVRHHLMFHISSSAVRAGEMGNGEQLAADRQVGLVL